MSIREWIALNDVNCVWIIVLSLFVHFTLRMFVHSKNQLFFDNLK